MVWSKEHPTGHPMDPRNLECLLKMSNPSTAADHRQSYCAFNWLHKSIPDFAALNSPLHYAFNELKSKIRTKTSQLIEVHLSSDLSNKPTQSTLYATKYVIANWVALSQLSVSAQTRVIIFLRQCARKCRMRIWINLKAFNDIPLAFVSDDFKKTMFKWSTFEKEAFAVVYPMARLNYFASCENIQAFTDHNLKFLFYLRRRQPTIHAYKWLKSRGGHSI